MISRHFVRIQTELPGPRSAAVFSTKERYVASPLTTYAPFIIKKSKGAIVEDLDGNTFLDFSGGWGCLNVGPNRSVLAHGFHCCALPAND